MDSSKETRTIKSLIRKYVDELASIYPAEESRSLAQIALEFCLKLDRTHLLLLKEFPEDQSQKLESILFQLKKAIPIQYILGEAHFYGRNFHVDSRVLIPRPETEELLKWILDSEKENVSILDIGTGSGCIASTLKLERQEWTVKACDVSEEALLVAMKNAEVLGAEVEFFKADLNYIDIIEISDIDVIVSNPPYIPLERKEKLHENVVKYEPHIALFTPENDPLYFYKKVAELALEKLKIGGRLYFEADEEYTQNLKALLHALGFRGIQIKIDLFGKERFVKAYKPQQSSL